jgi:hypothetical protein
MPKTFPAAHLQAACGSSDLDADMDHVKLRWLTTCLDRSQRDRSEGRLGTIANRPLPFVSLPAYAYLPRALGLRGERLMPGLYVHTRGSRDVYHDRRPCLDKCRSCARNVKPQQVRDGGLQQDNRDKLRFWSSFPDLPSPLCIPADLEQRRRCPDHVVYFPGEDEVYMVSQASLLSCLCDSAQRERSAAVLLGRSHSAHASLTCTSAGQ